MPTFTLVYQPLTGPVTLAVVKAPSFAEAALRLPAYQWVLVARPSRVRLATSPTCLPGTNSAVKES